MFSKMSKELDICKDNLQCRSHHQKMVKKYHTIQDIINHIMDRKNAIASKPEDNSSPVEVNEPLKEEKIFGTWRNF